MNSLKRILLIIFLNLIIAAILIFSSGNKSINSKNGYGVKIWRSKNCNGCHSIYGLGGHIGPDLTNVYNKGGKEYIDYILINGLGNMPNLELTKIERDGLINFLKYINSLGEYPLPSLTDNPFGKNNDVR